MSAPAAPEPRDRWALVVATGLAVFMGQVDTSIVNVALPTIERAYHTRPGVTEWLVLGYLLPLLALGLPSGRWLDQVGRRPAFLLAVAGFGVASVAAGLAPGVAWLIAARVVQGAFAAVLFAVTPVMATLAVRPAARGRAMGIITTVGPLGAISGPVVGGLLIESLGWPSIFLVNVPVCLALLVLGAREIPAGAPLRRPDRAWLVESLLLGGAALALLLALSLGAERGLLWLTLALAALPPLAVWWRTASSRRLRELLRAPGMRAPHVALFTTAVAVGGLTLLLPYYLQRVLETPPRLTGLTLLASPLAMTACGALGGVLADRLGARRVATVGAAVLLVGLLLLVPLGTTWAPGDVAWRLLVVGAGTGLFNAPNMAAAMASAPPPLLGTTGASLGLARQLGFALGPALGTVAWAASGYALPGMRAAVGIAALLAMGGVAVLARASAAARGGVVLAPSAAQR